MNGQSLTHDRAQSLPALTGALLFALTLFGYPIIGNFVSWLEIESRIISIPFRVLVAALSITVIAVASYINLDRWRFMVLLIWYALALRLGYDTSIAIIDSAEYALEFFLIACVLPALAIWALDAYNQKYYSSIGFIVASVGSLTALLADYYGLLGESSLTEITGRLSSLALNPVSLGHLALSGFFCGLTLIRSMPIWVRAPIALIMMALVMVIIQTGSKGPVIGLVIILLIWAKQRALIAPLIGLVVLAVMAIFVYSDNPFAQRLMAIEDDPSTIDRITLIQDSIRQIASSPWIGSASVELTSGSYPHNIFLEGALAFGLPLTMMLALLLFYGFSKSLRLLKTENDLIPLLFLQAIVISQISGALFADSMLWACLILILGFETVNHEKKLHAA